MRAHDIRTFPMLPYNQEHLEKMASGKKIGRPPGSGNKNSPAKRLQQLTETARQWLGLEMGQSTAKMQHHLHGGQADPKGRRTRFLRPSCAHSLNQHLRRICSVCRSARFGALYDDPFENQLIVLAHDKHVRSISIILSQFGVSVGLSAPG